MAEVPLTPEPGGGVTDALIESAPMLVLTGLSGAGRSTAAKVLEDLGWYVVDNLPPQLLGELKRLQAEAPRGEEGQLLRLAVVIDARSRALAEEFSGMLGALRSGPTRPVFVFLDEPTAGLDPHGRLDVYDLLRDLRAEGRTLVVTTHSFEEAQSLATHLVILSAGRTVAEGTLDHVTGTASLEDVYFALTRKASR